MTVRSPRRYFGDNYTGAVTIARAGHAAVPFESLLEQDWLVLEDAFDVDLRSITAQPMKIEYRCDGRTRIWIPDFLVRRKGKERADLVEVKPLVSVYPDDRDEAERERKRAHVKARFDAIRMAALSRGFEFVLATENEIRIEPRLRNASMLRRCADGLFPAYWEEVGRMAALALPHASSVRDLQRMLPAEVDAFSVALRLAWVGELELDPTRNWSRETTFVRARRP